MVTKLDVIIEWEHGIIESCMANAISYKRAEFAFCFVRKVLREKKSK